MIKSTIGKHKNTEFPKLMLSPQEDYIVLLTEQTKGFVIWSTPSGFEVGFTKEDWSLANFTDYNEQVTLQNA
jgi:hypothetical protein